MCQQGATCLRLERRLGQSVASAELAQKELGEQDHVLAARPQRRQLERHDIEPVIQVFAEQPLLYRGREVGVGRGDDAHVDGPTDRRAEALHALLIERAQQLALQLGGEVVDLVEEQRAAFGDFEQARFGGSGVGERAPLVAE